MREDWHDGYIEHMEIQTDLLDLIINWASEIWRAAIKPKSGGRLREAFEALKVVEEWIGKEMENEFMVRVEWREGDSVWDVEDDGRKIYTGLPEVILCKMWRDLVLRGIVNKDEEVVKLVLENCFDEGKDGEKPDFGCELVENLFAPRGKRLEERKAKEERGREATMKMIALLEGQKGNEKVIDMLSRPDKEESDNCDLIGRPIEDEWYADDEDMQAAREELKKMLKYEDK